MGLLTVLGLWALLVGPTLTEVMLSFEHCKKPFYKQKEPAWVSGLTATKICQKYNDNYYFSTLYDEKLRIPLWSAYTLTATHACPEQPGRMSKWFVEPQLTRDTSASANMLPEGDSGMTMDELESHQALNVDYDDTSYVRGQLNPHLLQCDNDRVATFTLTNAVPLDPSFSQNQWYNVEKVLLEQLSESCQKIGGTAHLVTGALSKSDKSIPDRCCDIERDRPRDFNRVSVPKHIWTAVCCDNPMNQTLKFSFALLADNKEDSLLRILSVHELENFIKDFYGKPHSDSLHVFGDSCNVGSQNGNQVVLKINHAMFGTYRDLMKNSYDSVLPPSEIERLNQEVSQVNSVFMMTQDAFKLRDTRIAINFPDLKEWHTYETKLLDESNLTCVLSELASPKSGENSHSHQCIIEQQKHIPPSTVTAQGWRCVGQVCGQHGGSLYFWCSTSYKPDMWDYCCSDTCALDPQTKHYQCSSGDNIQRLCSPRYSTVTVDGKSCRIDHPCGLYGKDYYWCYTDDRQTVGKCCSPSHYCGLHQEEERWCFVSDKVGNRDRSRCTP